MMNSLSKSNVAISLTLFSLAIAGLLMWYGGELPQSSFPALSGVEGPAVNLTAEQRNLLAMVTYLNAKGEKWSLPQGEYAFNVSSKAGSYPRFLSGDIDPLDVKVGDTQRMKIVVVDVAPPKRVWAEIEHDAGKDTVPLALTGTKQLAREELERRPYLVDENGKLISSSLKAHQSLNGLNDASNRISEKSIIERLVNKAQAEGEAQYTYEGQWVVHDTHTKTYRTTFVAEGSNGKRATNVLAWSDPDCPVTSLGVIQNSCTAQPGSVEGFDGSTRTLLNTDVQIHLLTGAKLVFNQGGSIDVSQSNVSITIDDGATIERGYIYYPDQDGDGYANNIQRYTFPVAGTGDRYQSGSTWYTRAKAIRDASTNLNQNIQNADLDCYDSGANAGNVHPGQTQYFGARDGRSSFDYDCSNSITGTYTATPNTAASVGFGYSQVYYFSSQLNKNNGVCNVEVGTRPNDSFYYGLSDADCGVVSGNSLNSCTQAFSPPPALSLFERVWNAVVPTAFAIPVRYEGWYANTSCSLCISGSLKGYCR